MSDQSGADYLDFLPLFQETMTAIRSRLDADLNAGLDPTDERRVDTRPGGFYYDITQPVLMEMARLWDAIASEVPAASSPATAWGDYLDMHASVFGLERKPAVAAGGEVRVTGTPGSLVAQGAVFTTEQLDPDVEPPEFASTASGTIGAQVPKPSAAPVATPATSGGTLASGTYGYAVTAINSFGETLPTAVTDAVVVGPTGRVSLTWNASAGASAYRVYRRPSAAGALERLVEVVSPSYNDTGAATGGAVPELDTTGGVRVPIVAVIEGEAGNVGVGAISEPSSALPGVDTVYNETPTVGGEEPETDEALRERLLAVLGGQGAGTVGDYERWALEWPGIGRVFVEPIWNGAGTVRVMVMTEAGQPVAPQVVTEFQAYLDPAPGLGHGRAPIGATVTVATPTMVTIPITAAVTFEPGFSLDGASGTVANRATIIAALTDYLNNLPIGVDVVKNHIEAQFFTVRGVYDVTLTAPAAAVTAIANNQTAAIGTVTLT